MPTGSWHLLKVNCGQKVQLIIAASHFVVSWLLLLDFKHRYVVLVIASTSLCLLFPVICVMACRRVIVPFHHIIIISSLLHFVFAYQLS